MDIEEGATDITREEATFEGETAGDKNGLIVGVGDRDENRSWEQEESESSSDVSYSLDF